MMETSTLFRGGRGGRGGTGAQRARGRGKPTWVPDGSTRQHSSGHSLDGERWEHGRGRGRGSGLSTRGRKGNMTWHKPTSVAVADGEAEMGSGTEDAQGEETGVEDEANILEDAESEREVEEMDVLPEIHEPALDSPEEREQFYQRLVKEREAERLRAIAEGKMDDPTKPKRLEDAICVVGTCPDMCPRFERYRRERENNLDRLELVRFPYSQLSTRKLRS